MELSVAARMVLRERYLRRDPGGRVVESPEQMIDRVSAHVAGAEDLHRPGTAGAWAERFRALLGGQEFLPNSPTLMNAGTDIGLLSGCVVLPLLDSLPSIFAALGDAAVIHQAGGGTGYNFSHLRPAGDLVASTQGTATGPLSFLGLFDTAAAVIRQGGRRRGASMAVLDASHPDIGGFIESKAVPGRLEHFNLSVGVSDAYMRAVVQDGSQRLVNPRTGRVVTRVPARALFEGICRAAHQSGDPGLLFLDAINRANPLPDLGPIEATNPCGEVPLHPYESCNLGSINLARLVRDGRVDWDRLGEVARLAIRFLDDVIDVSRYPVAELDRAARATRKVGLGIMGLAEMLALLGIPYDSAAALRLAGRLAKEIRVQARRASAALAEERGAFAGFSASTLARSGLPPLRNAQLTSVAPTGTISLLAGTTSGIEPFFAVAYLRNILGRHIVEVNPLFRRLAQAGGFYTEDLVEEIARRGTVRGNPRVPAQVGAVFPTAAEMAPEWHLRMQAAVQRHVDAAVSKTINLPAEATVDEVRDIFMTAWRLRVKGITVYRYGSRPAQVLSLVAEQAAPGEHPVLAETGYAGGCAGHDCEF